jgi:hypothetical protein
MLSGPRSEELAKENERSPSAMARILSREGLEGRKKKASWKIPKVTR